MKKSRSGFGLIETIVAIGIAGIVMVGIEKLKLDNSDLRSRLEKLEQKQ